MATLPSEIHPAHSGELHSRQTKRSDAAQFEKLYELVARLAACYDLDPALREVLDASMDVVGADAGYIRFFELDVDDPISSRYPFAVHKGISEGYLEYFGNLAQPVSNTGRQAVFDGRRVIIDDMTSHPSFEAHRELVIAEGYKTMQATPLMSRNGSKCVGVICTYFREIQTPPYVGLETLDLYANIAGSMIDNYRQRAELLRQDGWLAAFGLPFGELLRRFRQSSGMTQLELAEKAGLSHRTISDLERGVRSKVYASTVILLATALDLNPEDAETLAASVNRSRKTSSRQTPRSTRA